MKTKDIFFEDMEVEHSLHANLQGDDKTDFFWRRELDHCT